MRYYTELEPAFPDQGDWTLATVLRHHAARRPDAVALDLPEEGLTLTYAQALQQAESVADRLAEAGARTGDRVLVMAANSSQFLRTWLGTGIGGTVEVPINTAYEGVFLEHQVATSAPRFAVIDDVHAAKFAAVGDAARVVERFWVVDTGSREQALTLLREHGWTAGPWEDLVVGARSGARFPTPPPHALASIFFTSGTTGPSKGVAMPHAQMYFFGQEVVSLQRLTPEDTYFTCTPLFHGNAQFMAAYPALIAGARLVCRPRFSASRWVAQLRESGVTATNLIGVMMDFVWKQPPRPDDADNVLRTVFAAPTASSIVEGFKDRYGIEAFTEVFGLTETSAPILSPYGEDRPAGAAGLAAADWFDVRLVDPETDREVPLGEVGELVVRPRHPWTCSLGYFGMPEKTAEAWRNLWFHTGDALRRDADGWFYFVDRYKDALRRRGENISSYEVEQGLLSHPGVLEVAVVGVAADSEAGEDEVMAFVVADPAGPGVTAAELWDWCTGRVPGFAVPRYVRFVDALPRTPSEKVQKAVLRADGVTADTHDRTAVTAAAGAR
ncbi:crotonobetaine/carnitine-CoA ligase [Geodermatophilus amargosae]|uniref:Crotonobetaine/carnitine-CoA ligase n=1 Tax=Geodermatophilus amargosae TaxID=1296565 RepID=A0A1I7C2G8_9ACTN|nr:AMP-binding protein [Geodermatophilus amargosae]SFT93627.1 crotonobetaine/carnitine-CoA ligase [Geodermatophilus amargosae]